MKKVLGCVAAIVRDGQFWYLRTLPTYRFTLNLSDLLKNEDLFKDRERLQEFLNNNVTHNTVYMAVMATPEKATLMGLVERVPIGSLKDVLTVVDVEVTTNT